MNLLDALVRRWAPYWHRGSEPRRTGHRRHGGFDTGRAIHYLETSGVNALADRLGVSEWNVLAQRACRFDMCVSPLVLWEILLNRDASRRDYLIYWMQFSCADRLLKSPVEIVVDFIQRGTPSKERALFARDPFTKLDIGRTWTSIHGKPDRTVHFDVDSLRNFSKTHQEFSKLYARIVDAMVLQDDTNGDEFHRLMIELCEEDGLPPSERKQRLVKTSLLIAFLMLCIGIEPDSSPLDAFWAPLGVDNSHDPSERRPFERLEYLVMHCPMAFQRGPILEMASMLVIQRELGGRMNRGAFFDAMHAVYCYYVGNTVTADSHFLALKERTDTPTYDTVVSAKDYMAVLRSARRTVDDRRSAVARSEPNP